MGTASRYSLGIYSDAQAKGLRRKFCATVLFEAEGEASRYAAKKRAAVQGGDRQILSRHGCWGQNTSAQA
jgi:hypothetical protein